MNRQRTLIVVVAIVLVAGLAATVVVLTGGDEPAPTDGTAAPTPTPTTSATEPDEAATTDPGPDPTLEPTGDPTTPAGAEPEMRGIWVHLFDRSLKTKKNILAFLDTAAAANFNTVIVQGARRHDAFYDSDVLPRTTDEEMADGLDMLGTLVPAAHERGLDVHVWYAVAPTMHATMLDEDLGPDHINSQHGFGTDDPWLQAGNDRSYAYMDPAIPGFQEHVAAMYRDVVERYDIDGIHLDYLRYECLQVTDDGTCRYDAEPGAGATANQHPTTMARYRDHGQGSLADFMRQQTEDLVRRIYLEVADVDPTVVVSGALIAQGDGPGPNRDAFSQAKAYWNKGQDWASWIDHGILDEAFPMAYFRESDPRWAKAYDDWTAFAQTMDSDEHVVALGQAAYLNCVDQSLDQIRQSRRRDRRRRRLQLPGDHRRGRLRPAAAGRPAAAAARRHVRRARPGPRDPPQGRPDPGPPPRPGQRRAAGDRHRPGRAGADAAGDATGHAGFVWVDPGAWQVPRRRGLAARSRSRSRRSPGSTSAGPPRRGRRPRGPSALLPPPRSRSSGRSGRRRWVDPTPLAADAVTFPARALDDLVASCARTATGRRSDRP